MPGFLRMNDQQLANMFRKNKPSIPRTDSETIEKRKKLASALAAFRGGFLGGAGISGYSSGPSKRKSNLRNLFRSKFF